MDTRIRSWIILLFGNVKLWKMYVCMYVWLLKTSITTRCRIEGVRTNRRARRRAWEAEACTETPVKILLEKVKMLTHYWGREIKVSIRGITCKQATSFRASPLWKSCRHPRGLLFRNSWPPTVLPFSKPSWTLTERKSSPGDVLSTALANRFQLYCGTVLLWE